MVLFLIIPISMQASGMIEATYEQSMETAVKEAESITEEINENTDEEGNVLEQALNKFCLLYTSCASVSQVEELLHKANIRDTAFAPQMPPAPLHWMIADQERCLVAEMVAEGLKLYDNPAGVLTNNPPFPYHQMNLANYLNVTAAHPDSRFSNGLDLAPYAEGMGGLGLPGDASSPSRFVKAAFLKWNSAGEKEEEANVSQFFPILDLSLIHI